MSSSSKESGSRRSSMRSRAVSLPCRCWASMRSSPPPCNAFTRRSANLAPASRIVSRLERLELRDDFAGDNFDLAHLVLVRHKDQLLYADRKVLLELRNALVHRADDRAILGRIAPRRIVPFLAQPLHHLRFDCGAGLADHDGQLRAVHQRVRVLAGLRGEVADLCPRLGEALRSIEIGKPT